MEKKRGEERKERRLATKMRREGEKRGESLGVLAARVLVKKNMYTHKCHNIH